MAKTSRISSLRLLYLSIFSFVFISSFSLSLNKIVSLRSPKVITLKENYTPKVYPLLPILKNSDGEPVFTAESVLAVDVNSGVVLFQKNPEELLFPASTTKMMTALTALDGYDLDQIITVGNVRVVGQKMNLQVGEKISVRDLISGLLIYSANDAAEVLAQNYCLPGSDRENTANCGRQVFIDAMNQKAKDLNLSNTRFMNPTGLDNEGHLTTARDLSLIAVNGMKNHIFRSTVGTKETTVMSTDGLIKHRLANLNLLLGEVDGVLGVKTGWTENAKENLVTFIDRGGNDIVIVILKSNDRFGESKTLINWIYSNYEWIKVIL